MHTSNNDIRRGNVGPLQPGKEIDSSRTNICKHHIQVQKIHIWVREKANTLLNKSKDGSGPGQLECDVVHGVSGFSL